MGVVGLIEFTCVIEKIWMIVSMNVFFHGNISKASNTLVDRALDWQSKGPRFDF